MLRLLSLILLLCSSLPALAQFGAQAVAAGRWEPRNYTNSLGLQLLFCSYWTNGITLNGGGVSAWTNRLANGFDLTQGTAIKQPVLTNDAPWGGLCLYFDGSNDSLVTLAMPSMVQPTVVMWGGRQVTWTDTEFIFDGAAAGYCGVLYQKTASPDLRAYAGEILNVSGPALGAWSVITTIFNTTSSSVTVNKTVTTGSTGDRHMKGITLGKQGVNAAGWANIETFGLLAMTNTSAAATNYARLGFLGMAGTK